MDGLVAGITAGAATTLAMHPLDIVKIRLQVGKTASLQAAVRELAQGSIRDAYRGLTPNLVGNGVAWGCYFYLYEFMQKIIVKEAGWTGPHGYWTSAFSAGVLTQTATNPIWVLKTQLLASRRNEKGSPANATAAAINLVKREGLRGLWRGYVPGLFGTVQSSVYFSIYGTLKPVLKPRLKSDLWTYLVASATAKTLAACIFYPHQVLRSRMQTDKRRTTLTHEVVEVYNASGLRGFYRGLSANLIRVVPSMTITLMVYETTKKAYNNYVHE